MEIFHDGMYEIYIVYCKLENKNQEEKFYWEILKNSNLPTNLTLFVYKHKGMKLFYDGVIL